MIELKIWHFFIGWNLIGFGIWFLFCALAGNFK